MKRSFIVCCLLVISISFLTGCSSKSDQNSSQETAQASSTENNPVDSSPAVQLELSADVSKVTTRGGQTGTAQIVLQVFGSNNVGLKKEVLLDSPLGKLLDISGQELSKVADGLYKIVTDDQGRAVFYFESGDTPGTAIIQAQVDNLVKEIQLELVAIGSISSDVQRYLLKGQSELLKVYVHDIYNNPANGIKVLLSSSNNDVLSVASNTLVTDENGEASIYISAGSPEITTDVTLSVQSGGQVINIPLSVVVPANLKISVSGDTTINAGEVLPIRVFVSDQDGNPIPSVPVSFSAALGSMSSSVVTTDSNGIAVSDFTSNIPGTATIRADAGGLSDELTIKVVASNVVGVPVTIQCESIEKQEIFIQGSGQQDSSRITFKVLDGQNNPVPNVRIQFQLVGGSQGGEYLVPTSAITDENGEVSTVLKSGTKPGIPKILAQYNTSVYTEIQSIAISSGPPEGRHLSLSVKSLNIAGLIYFGLQDEISFRLADLYSNPVPDGTAVYFGSEFAKIDGADYTGTADEPGLASTILYSQDPRPDNGEWVHVWGQVNSGSYAHITDLYVDPNDVNKIYAATDGGGLFLTTNFGNDWLNIAKPRTSDEAYSGLWGTYINNMAVRDNLLVVATEDNGVLYSEDGGIIWRDLMSKTDEYTDYNVYSGNTLTCFPINLRERINVSLAGFSYISWNVLRNVFFAKDAGPYVVSYKIDYNTPGATAKIVKILDDNTFFAYFANKGIWKFDKSCLHWSEFNYGLSFKDVSTMVLIDSDANGTSDKIFVTIGDQLYASPVNAPNFQAVDSPQSVSFNDVAVYDNFVFYATSAGIKKFDIAVNRFVENISLDIPDNNIKYIVVTEDGNGNLVFYLATDLGLYRISEDAASGSYNAYPLNVYMETQNITEDTRTIILQYPADQNKSHTIIYENGTEISQEYYDFVDDNTIKIKDDVDPIPAGSVLKIYYTLKAANGNYVEAPYYQIYAIKFAHNKLFFATQDRKLFVLNNPLQASNGALPEIQDISGLNSKITSVLYKTSQVVFSGKTVLKAYWDADGDGFFDDANINIPNGSSQDILITVSDQYGNPLKGGSQVSIECSAGTCSASSFEIPDALVGGLGITEFWIRISDSDPTNSEEQKGSMKISIISDNGDISLTISYTIH